MVGTVTEIWRYPVKSMAGEMLDSAALTDTGFDADRRWALVDGTANRAGKLLTGTEGQAAHVVPRPIERRRCRGRPP